MTRRYPLAALLALAVAAAPSSALGWESALYPSDWSPGFTDAKSWHPLGMKGDGFLPLRLPPEIKYADLCHGDNERIPLAGLDWGTRVLWDALLNA